MRIGMVCPYSVDTHGGVQAHVLDLAKVLIAGGHQVSVLAPGDEDGQYPSYLQPAGRSFGIRYNGSVARLSFGPVSYTKVRRWIRAGDFDLLHVHEPAAPSLSLLATMVADGPIVATFHTSNAKSRMLLAWKGVLQQFLEKISGRIAVSEAARRVQVDHLDSDAVIIPNGVDVAFFADGQPLPGYRRQGPTVGFIGRYDEPRKGMDVLLAAMRQVIAAYPDAQLLVVGGGDANDLRRAAGRELAGHLHLTGRVSDADKVRALHSMDVYCAPNTGGESFGIILTEAMAAGCPVVAADLAAFQAVLDDGTGKLAGRVFRNGDANELAAQLIDVLRDGAERDRLAQAGRQVVRAYDWPVVASKILAVYETVTAAHPGHVVEAE